jgi:glyoxylase-like metal-dependent hydrolase (beta-lactamase superfamily II)
MPAVAIFILACCGIAAGAMESPESFTFVPGSFASGSEPDGNSVVINAPDGLIVVDTGRHPEHQQRILAIAKASKKPIVAIINSHWHLDHTGGNAGILKAYPAAQVYASTAIKGALTGFFPKSRADAERFLASGKATAAQSADIRRDIARVEQPSALEPTRPITRDERLVIAGQPLDIHLARFAATEGDVWLQDGNVVIAGDLVVAMVPFLDTACPEGWRQALDVIAAARFEKLIPGHGEPMTRPQFLRWRRAFDNLLDCSASGRSRQQCVDGWMHDADEFIPAGQRERIASLTGYYLDSRLRASGEEKMRYCRPLH